MALTNATTLADYGAGIGTQGATLKVDATNKRVGVGTDSPAGPEGSLQVGTGITFFGNTGIVSAIGGKFSGDFTVGGALTFEDVTNIDSVGIITAQSHVSIADSILHTGDTDTSIRFPAAGTFTVETNGSEAFRVDSSQRLLVNTTSEMETFGSAALQVATAAGGTLVLGRDDTSVSVDNGIGAIYFDTKAGGSFAESAVIAAEADAAQGSGDYPSRLVFKTTADGAGSVTERLRITAAGRIGINSTSPGALFTVNTGGTEDAFRVGSPNGSDTIFRLGSTNTDTDTHAVIKYDKDDNYLSFVVSGESHGAGGVLIANGGNVGIATANPGAVLSIQGGESATPRFAIQNTTASTNDFTITQYEDGNGVYSLIGQNVKLDSSGNNSVLDSSFRTAAVQVDARNHGAVSFLTGGTNAVAERIKITSDGTLFSFSPDDTTPNFKWRSDDTNWHGALNISVEGASIASFWSTGGDWSVDGTTYSCTKNVAAYNSAAIALHNQYNSSFESKLVFLNKAGGSTLTDGAVTELASISSAGVISDAQGPLRRITYKQETSAYTLVAADAGKAIEIQGNLTVPNSVFVGGDAITIINDSGSNKTISKGTGLTYMFNTADGTNANRTLGGRGMATIYFVNSTTCYISGSQLS